MFKFECQCKSKIKPMRHSLEKSEKYVVLTPNENKIIGANAPALKSEFVLLSSNESFNNIICNLENVNYTDSSGLSSILVGNRLCNEKNGKFVICGLKQEVQKLIELSKLDSILNITPTLSEAKDFILLSELENEVK